MNKHRLLSTLIFFIMALLSGCGPIGSKSASLISIYSITTILAFLILIGYFFFVPTKDRWLLVLLISVLIVNIGYYGLARSQTLSEALFYNRVSYLGSVFLPMSMLMIILNVVRLKYKKHLPWILSGISLIVFLITASPGYSTIYYEHVSLEIVNGVSMLIKTYGSWHSLYLIYLLAYFGGMIGLILHSIRKKKLETLAHAVILTLAVMVNIGVWLFEQLVHIDFEFLAVSYIISEIFLLALQYIMTENYRLKELMDQKETELKIQEETLKKQIALSQQFSLSTDTASYDSSQIQLFKQGIEELTPTEKIIYEAYVARATTKEIRASLNITENTLKFHNKNIYSKLGVSSRKELMEIYKHL